MLKIADSRNKGCAFCRSAWWPTTFMG